MLVDCVDQRDQVVGKVKRKDIFRGSCGFRTVHVFVVNSNGKLLLQQQSHSRDRAPLTWGSSVAAYLFSGETYEKAAARRLQQELGVSDVDITLLGVLHLKDLGHDKFVGLAFVESSGPFTPDPNHIERVRLMSPNQVLARWRKGSMALTPTFLALLEFYNRVRGQDTVT